MAQVPITGARGTLPTARTVIYATPKTQVGTAYVTIENITFTNTVSDDAFTITLYQNSGNSTSPTILWSYEFTSQAKTVVDGDVKKLLYGDSLLAICDKPTVEFVINGYYDQNA